MTSPTTPDFLAPSRTHVMLLDRGLSGGYGATRAFASLTPATTHLILNHNPLSDSGVRMLFHLLSKRREEMQEKGLESLLEEVQLNSCDVGDEGMRAIAGYLEGDHALRTLYLSNNQLSGDPSTVELFTQALNSSHLAHLALSTNPGLGDPFLALFLPGLSTPHLRSLHMSMLGLTATSIPVLIRFLTHTSAPLSPASSFIPPPTEREEGRTHLDLLTLNANSLTYSGIQQLITAVEQAVPSLLVLELDGNTLQGEEESPQGARRWLTRLRGAMLRNGMLRAQVRTAALRTLLYARTLLNAHPAPPSSEEQKANQQPAPFLRLPPELHHLILRHLGDPNLAMSDGQFARVVDYATTWEPTPSPSLAVAVAEEPLALSRAPPAAEGAEPPAGAPDSQERGMSKLHWLERVGCAVYERELGREDKGRGGGVPDKVELVGY